MSAQNPASLTEWWKNLPIPWLVGDAIGQAEATANGTVVDHVVALVKAATKAHMPGQGPSDALPHIGGDRQLEQGPTETDASFRIRLQTAWDDWARAGTALELLVQLYWDGFPGAVIVQQNGLAYSLSGSPTAGVDPTSLLTITTLGANPTISGAPPWWTFDQNNSFCSRFAVLFPSGGGAFTTSGVATFDGTSDTAIATWSNAFPDTTYVVQVGAVYSADPVAASALPATKTTTGVSVVGSGPFVGTIELLAWQIGANPWADLHPADLARLRRLIARWRPAKATCKQISVVAQGRTIGWPARIIGNGTNIGPSSVVAYSAA